MVAFNKIRADHSEVLGGIAEVIKEAGFVVTSQNLLTYPRRNEKEPKVHFIRPEYRGNWIVTLREGCVRVSVGTKANAFVTAKEFELCRPDSLRKLVSFMKKTSYYVGQLRGGLNSNGHKLKQL